MNLDDCACLLVEVIAKHSQDIKWGIRVDRTSKREKFYSMVKRLA